MKLCKDCESYVERGYNQTGHYDDICNIKFEEPVRGRKQRGTCGWARESVERCGVFAKHFKPRKKPTLEDFLKSRPGEYVTLGECARYEGGEEAFKAVDHRLIEFDIGEGETGWAAMPPYEFTGRKFSYRIRLTSTGELPQARPKLRNGLKLPDGWGCAMDKDGNWYAYEVEPVKRSTIFFCQEGSDAFNIPKYYAPTWQGDWKDSWTVDPETEGQE